MKFLNSFCTFQIFISDIHYGKREMGSSAKKIQKGRKLHSLRRILPLAKQDFHLIQMLPYIHMSGLGSNLDSMNLNCITIRFTLKMLYKVISYSIFSWSWSFFPTAIHFFCLSFQKYESISKGKKTEKENPKKKQ